MDYYDKVDATTLGIIVAAAMGFFTLLIVFFQYLYGDKRDTVLLVGLSDSGKTFIFSKLANKGLSPSTFTSMQENIMFLNVKSKFLKIVDFPGNDRLRRKLVESYLHSPTLLKIIFLVDSSTFSKKARDVAELFYDVALETNKKTDILIACHKQDQSLAKSEQVIRTSLEKEIGLINKSRSAALKGTDGSESRNATLTATGTDFVWTDITGRKVDFAPTSAIDGADIGIEAIRSFLKA